MDRTPEPELMEDEAQARAYAEADFDEPHSMFVRLWEEWRGGEELAGTIVDLGCGPADITVRFAERYLRVRLDGIDGSRAMLDCARERIRRHGLESRIRLIQSRLPDEDLPRAHYDAVISNSLLHHLTDPAVLWRTIRACARPGAPVFVMDLMRPESRADAEALVERHAAGEPAVLRRDFFHSLLAAWRPDEVRAQLAAAGLDGFRVGIVSDRHMTISGETPGLTAGLLS
jgi:SAM-dependent methyltransferase